VMDHGRIIQQGSPWDLYKRPDNIFVAQFLGDITCWREPWSQCKDRFVKVLIEDTLLTVIPFKEAKDGPVRVGITPGRYYVGNRSWRKNAMRGKVVDRHFSGGLPHHVQVGKGLLRLRPNSSESSLSGPRDLGRIPLRALHCIPLGGYNLMLWSPERLNGVFCPGVAKFHMLIGRGMGNPSNQYLSTSLHRYRNH